MFDYELVFITNVITLQGAQGPFTKIEGVTPSIDEDGIEELIPRDYITFDRVANMAAQLQPGQAVKMRNCVILENIKDNRVYLNYRPERITPIPADKVDMIQAKYYQGLQAPQVAASASVII